MWFLLNRTPDFTASGIGRGGDGHKSGAASRRPSGHCVRPNRLLAKVARKPPLRQLGSILAASATADRAHTPGQFDHGIEFEVQAPYVSPYVSHETRVVYDPRPQDPGQDVLHPFRNRAGFINPYRVANVFYRMASIADGLDPAARNDYAHNVVVPLIHGHHQELDAVAVCAAVYLLARLQATRVVDTLDLLLCEAEYLYPRFEPRTFAVTLWSLAKLGYSPIPRWLATFLSFQRPTLHRGSPHDLAISLYALALLRAPPPPEYLGTLHDAALVAVRRFQPRDCAMLVWSHAALNLHPGTDVVHAFCGHAQLTMPYFTQQSFAVLTYGLAALREMPDEAWRVAFFDASLPHLPSASAKNLCLMIAAALTWHHEPPPQWVAAAVAAAEPLLQTMSAQDLSFLISGVAMWVPPLPSSGWLTSFERRAAQTFADFTPQTYTSVLFGFARVAHPPHPRFMEQLAQRLPEVIVEFLPRELSYLVWAFCLLDWTPPPRLLGPLMAHIRGVAPRLHHKGLANVLAAASKWPQVPASWKQDLVGQLQPKLQHHSAADLARVIGSVADLRCRLPAAWVGDYLQACLMVAPDFTAAQLTTVLASLRGLDVRVRADWVGRVLRECGWHVLARADAAALLPLAAAVSEAGHLPSSDWQARLYAKLGARWDALGVREVQQLLQCVGRWLRLDPIETEDALCAAWPTLGPLPPVAVARLAAGLVAEQLEGLRPGGGAAGAGGDAGGRYAGGCR